MLYRIVSFGLATRVWLLLVFLVLRAVVETVTGTARSFLSFMLRFLFSFRVLRCCITLHCIGNAAALDQIFP
jgi:hypothetical protein